MIFNQQFKFEAYPKVIKAKEPTDNKNINNNLMFEPRIIRGNTKNKFYEIKKKQNDRKLFRKKKTTNKRTNNQTNNFMNLENMISTPRAVDGRKHAEVMTKKYIEILNDKPSNNDIEIQTDPLLNKPIKKHFKIPKNGLDKETQILEEDNLFDFEIEVESIIQVMKNRVLEQSRMELLEEEELTIMKEQQQRFLQNRYIKLTEVQRLEYKEKRYEEEFIRRGLQNKHIYDKNRYIHKQLCSRVISKNFLKNIVNDTIPQLEEVGLFEKDFNLQLYSNFLPWMYNEVFENLENKDKINTNLENLLNDIQDSMKNINSQVKNNRKLKFEEKEENKKRKKEEKEERLRIKRLEEEKMIIEENKNKFIEEVENLIEDKTLKERLLIFSDCLGLDALNKNYVSIFGGIPFIIYLYSETFIKEELKNNQIIKKLIYNILEVLSENNNMMEFGLNLEENKYNELILKLDKLYELEKDDFYNTIDEVVNSYKSVFFDALNINLILEKQNDEIEVVNQDQKSDINNDQLKSDIKDDQLKSDIKDDQDNTELKDNLRKSSVKDEQLKSEIKDSKLNTKSNNFLEEIKEIQINNSDLVFNKTNFDLIIRYIIEQSQLLFTNKVKKTINFKNYSNFKNSDYLKKYIILLPKIKENITETNKTNSKKDDDQKIVKNRQSRLKQLSSFNSDDQLKEEPKITIFENMYSIINNNYKDGKLIINNYGAIHNLIFSISNFAFTNKGGVKEKYYFGILDRYLSYEAEFNKMMDNEYFEISN